MSDKQDLKKLVEEWAQYNEGALPQEYARIMATISIAESLEKLAEAYTWTCPECGVARRWELEFCYCEPMPGFSDR